MLLLITGASGMGKSSVRAAVAPAIEAEVAAAALSWVRASLRGETAALAPA